MKNLDTYITEKILINKDTNVSIFDDIDISKWSWPKRGISNEQYKQCKENVDKFACKHFNNTENYMSELYKQTYKIYLETDIHKLLPGQIEKSYNNAIKYLNALGWPQFSYNYVEQGWWHFTNWLIEQYNEQNNKI